MNRRTFTLLTLFSALLGPTATLPAGADRDGEEEERLLRRLQISQEQQEKIKHLYRESDRRKRAIDERLGQLYRELDTLYGRYEFDRVKVRAVTDEISEQRRQSLALYMDNEEKLRRILKREQFERLRDITRVRKGERKTKDRERRQ